LSIKIRKYFLRSEKNPIAFSKLAEAEKNKIRLFFTCFIFWDLIDHLFTYVSFETSKMQMNEILHKFICILCTNYLSDLISDIVSSMWIDFEGFLTIFLTLKVFPEMNIS